MLIKKILLTGSSGFLGQTIRKHLKDDFSLHTLGRSRENDVVYDFINEELHMPGAYDLVIHCAGKAHMVPQTEAEKKAFFDINVKGSSYLLDALSRAPSLPKAFVFISSVAVYGADKGVDIKETQPLNAMDPYGLSKIQAEELIWNWCEINDVKCAILRLPLLVGSNPPGNLKSMINGLKKGYYFNIAGGTARKSMVLTDDIARIILKAANVGGIFNLTDGHHPSFAGLSNHMASQLGVKAPGNIPMWIAGIMAKIGDQFGANAFINSKKLDKINSNLTFDDAKARHLLSWNPTPVIKGFKL